MKISVLKSQFCVLVPIFCIIMVIFSFFNVSFLHYSTSNLQASNVATLQMVSKQPELISSFSTNYKDSPEERKFNIRLALKSLDGKSIMPGEEFSFNKVVGLRTEERGYKKALVILKVVIQKVWVVEFVKCPQLCITHGCLVGWMLCR